MMNNDTNKSNRTKLRYKNRKKHFNTMKSLYVQDKSKKLKYVHLPLNRYTIKFSGKTPKEHIIIRLLRKIEGPVMTAINGIINIKNKCIKSIKKIAIIIVDGFSGVKNKFVDIMTKRKTAGEQSGIKEKVKIPHRLKEKAKNENSNNGVHVEKTKKNGTGNAFDIIKERIFKIGQGIADFFKGLSSAKIHKANTSALNDNNANRNFGKHLPKIFNTKFGIIIPVIILLGVSGFAWYYKEYISVGTFLGMGNIECLVNQYDKDGALIGEITDVATVVYENNIGNMTRNSKFIELNNAGTLDLEYNITFELDANIANSGVLFYRIYEVTDGVLQTTPTDGSTKLETYAANNPLLANVEFDTALPVSNMSTIGRTIMNGTLNADSPGDTKYYRLDYGMYSTINSTVYSGNVVSVHTKVFISQVGAGNNGLLEGEVWQVENEQQFRSAIANAISGDTIKLVNDVTIEGSVDIIKRLHLDTNGFTLNVTGDLLYEFIEVGELNINVVGSGKIDVGNDFRVEAPKSRLQILGSNSQYDIFVNRNIIFNGLQNEEEDGVLLDNVRIVNNKVGSIPANIYVMSNTRLTIGPGVVLGNIIAMNGATNIEILNNGTVVQILLNNMALLDTFAKPQIYIYNLNTILGVVGGTGIVLPATSTPYLGPNNGNTLIVKGASSTDVTVSGSTNFTQEDVEYVNVSEDVIPIVGEEKAYIVYIRDVDAVVQDLLIEYFTLLKSEDVDASIAEIEKLIFYTVNAQYFENEDFQFLASSALPNLHYLDLSNARVIDDTTINRIKNNAMYNKTSLKTLFLPKTLVEIGDSAFIGAPLGRIPSNMVDAFNFVTIPATVNLIESNAFSDSRYISFEGLVPPTVEENAFTAGLSGAMFFAPEEVINEYRKTANIDSDNIHMTSQLSDNRLYFVYETTEAVGISLYVSTLNIGDTLTIPDYILLTNRQYPVNEIGVGAFRHVLTPNDGTQIIIPNTVERIKDYAFYDKNITNINLSNILTIGDYAFYKTKLTRLEADSATSIGKYAFYNSKLQYATLENVLTIGEYAFTSNLSLYEINLGKVKILDDYALYNCPLLGRVYFKNLDTRIDYNMEVVDLDIGVNAIFDDWGTYLDGRLRVYVPDGNATSGRAYLGLYKNLFVNNEEYVYVTGDIIGSYSHGVMDYDWGEYSVREVNREGYVGYEIIEYHGEDLSSGYTIPTEVLMSYGISAELTNTNGWVQGTDYVSQYTYTLTNLTDSVIPQWTVKIQMPAGASRTGGWGAEFPLTNVGQSITVMQPNYGGEIAVGGTTQFTVVITRPVGSPEPTLLSAYTSTDETSPIISIGEGAYRHVDTTGTVAINTDNIVYIGDYGLYGLSIDTILAENLMYIGNYAFGNTGLSKAEFPDLYHLGDYALSNMSTLYSLNLGYVMEIGEYAVSDNPNLEQLFINTTDIDNMIVDENAFDNLGTKVNDRMRIYVPDGDRYINYYKNLFGYEDYIYAMGTIVGYDIDEDIGVYAVRVVTLNNRADEPVTGLEIIEYHGDNLTSEYEIPEELSLTIGGTEMPVISIGKNAYIHAKIENDAQLELSNNVLLEIGDNAFKGVKRIKSFSSTSLTNLGQYAFNNSTLQTIDIENIKTIKSYALSDMSTLYMANLGIVSTMEENALYNLDNLSQVFFNPDNETLLFHINSITNVGGSTNDRIRFYVDTEIYYEEKTVQTDVELEASVDTNNITSTSSGWWNPTYTYSVPIIVTNNSQQDVSDWSLRMSVSNNYTYQSVTGAVGSSISNAVIFGNTTSNGTITAGNSVTFTVTITSTNSSMYTPIFSNASGTHNETIIIEKTNEKVNTYKNLLRAEYRDYFYLKGEILGTYLQANIPYNIGEYSVRKISYAKKDSSIVNGWEIIEYHGPDLENTYTIEEELEIGDSGVLPIIGIGQYAYRWTDMNGAKTFNLQHDNLLYINASGFRDLQGIKEIDLPNVENIEEYGLYNNKLTEVALPKLYELGQYGMANNPILNYIDLGLIEKIGDYAFANDSGIEQIYFRSKNIDNASSIVNIQSNDNIFDGACTTIGNRLRIYVPDGQVGTVSYVNAYKEKFKNFEDYIYPTGIIVGNYTYSMLPYDIGVYSVREVTRDNIVGNSVIGYEIIEYHGPDILSDYDIPTEVNGTPVISIGDYAYRHVEVASNNTWNLLFNNSILYIGNYAFSNTDISMMNGGNITYIGKYAFANCNSLTSVEVTGVKTVDDYAFYKNTLMVSITLGNYVEYIGSYAIYNDYSTTTRNLYLDVDQPPQTGTQPFPARETHELSSWLTTGTYYLYSFYINVPSSAETTYEATFPYNEYDAPTITDRIGRTFGSGDHIVAYQGIGNYVYNILGDNALEIITYRGNTNQQLTIPATITVSGTAYNVTSLGANMFASTTNTPSIVIPQHVNTVSNDFLNGNTSITRITVDPNNQYYTNDNNGVLFNKDSTTLVKYPTGRTNTSCEVPATIMTIASNAFSGNTRIQTIYFNENISVIANNAFEGCSVLRDLYFEGENVPYFTGFNTFLPNATLYVPSAQAQTQYSNNVYLRQYSIQVNN